MRYSLKKSKKKNKIYVLQRVINNSAKHARGFSLILLGIGWASSETQEDQNLKPLKKKGRNVVEK